MSRPLLLYAAFSTIAIAVIAVALLSFVYQLPGERAAVATSAVVALAVQVAAFALARWMARDGNGIAGWGAGAVISIVTLVVYGLIVRGTSLSVSAALVSLASFLFVTELIEPPLLNA
jgi:hypothetical protein